MPTMKKSGTKTLANVPEPFFRFAAVRRDFFAVVFVLRLVVPRFCVVIFKVSNSRLENSPFRFGILDLRLLQFFYKFVRQFCNASGSERDNQIAFP